MPLLLRRTAAQKSALRLPGALLCKAPGAFDPIRGGLPPPRAPPPRPRRILFRTGFLRCWRGRFGVLQPPAPPASFVFFSPVSRPPGGGAHLDAVPPFPAGKCGSAAQAARGAPRRFSGRKARQNSRIGANVPFFRNGGGVRQRARAPAGAPRRFLMPPGFYIIMLKGAEGGKNVRGRQIFPFPPERKKFFKKSGKTESKTA